MQARNAGFRTEIERIFGGAGFIPSLGLRLVDCDPGWCETELDLRPEHLQQDGYVHAGVQATIADHTGGAAAATLMAEGQRVLTIEFKINLLRPGEGDRLLCRAEVLRPGRSVTVSESSVFGVQGGTRMLISKATVTLACLAVPGAAVSGP